MIRAARLIAIGNFDGVHVGHQHLLRGVVESAQDAGLKPTVMTFEPHPVAVLGSSSLDILTLCSRKVELLRQISPELEVIVQPFDEALSQLSPRSFAQDLLVRQYRAKRIMVGANFRFGFRRGGDLETLRVLGHELGFDAQAFQLFKVADQVVSSSVVREGVRAGKVSLVRRWLGRGHELHGVVVPGDRRGRELGFPTANLAAIGELLPQNGVYACWARVARAKSAEYGAKLAAVANVGVRPTVDGSRLSVEAHLLDFDGDLYGGNLRLELIDRIRDERRLDGLAALKHQIAQDVIVASDILAHESDLSWSAMAPSASA